MGIEEIKAVLEQMRNLPVDQRGIFQTALVTGMVKSIVWYIVVGLVIWALGRRMIQATLSVIREGRKTEPEGGK